MSETNPVPTLAEWAGGAAAFERLTKRFYEKVPDDPILAPLFGAIGADHAQHVAQFLAEVLGNEKPYTEAGGSHAQMISRHLGRHLSETQRRRWMALMLDTADELGFPNDPEFRAAFVSYLEWGTRLAALNSQDGVPPPADAPMPRWDWGPPGRPYQVG